MRGRKPYKPAHEDEIERFICTAEELSRVIGIGQRQIRNYIKSGMPRRDDKRFYLPLAIAWHAVYSDRMVRLRYDRLSFLEREETDLQEWPEPVDSLEKMQAEFERETEETVNQFLRDASDLGH